MQRALFDSFSPRSCTYLSSWGWETAPISFSPHLGSDTFGMDNCKSRQQKPAVQLSAAHRAKAAHGCPTTGFLFGSRQSLMLTCFWAVWWSCPHVTAAGKSAGERQGLPAAGHQGRTELVCLTTQKVLVLVHVLVFLPATRSTTPFVSPLKSRGFRGEVRCRCAGTPPRNHKICTLCSLHLCAHMKGHFTPHTLCYQARHNQLTALAQGYGTPGWRITVLPACVIPKAGGYHNFNSQDLLWMFRICIVKRDVAVGGVGLWQSRSI